MVVGAESFSCLITWSFGSLPGRDERRILKLPKSHQCQLTVFSCGLIVAYLLYFSYSFACYGNFGPLIRETKFLENQSGRTILSQKFDPTWNNGQKLHLEWILLGKWSGGPLFPLEILVRGPNFPGPDFQWHAILGFTGINFELWTLNKLDDLHSTVCWKARI